MQRSSGTLAAAHITKHHAAQLVLSDVTLVVPPGSRIGLVGPNGAGKSTLLRLLAGLEEPDSGTVRRLPAELAVGYLPQESDVGSGELLLAYLARRTGVAAVATEMDELAKRLGSNLKLAAQHANALDRFLVLGGGDLEARARTVCAELGLKVSLDAPLGALSGGERARAQLAAVLLARFDVFLLDEPTNDLDFAGLDRLEEFVLGLRGSVVVVSHDRDFLDRTVECVVELDEWTRHATEFIGGWSEYEQARAHALRRQTEAYGAYESEKTRLEEQLRRMQRWEERGYGQGRKKKKTKDVKKSIGGRIERLGAVDKPYEPWELRLELTPQARSGDLVVRLERAVVERGTFLLGPLDLELSWADRLAIVGPNGSGKTTSGVSEEAARTDPAGPQRRRRCSARACGGRAGHVPARPARSRALLGRSACDPRSERKRQDDAARRDSRTTAPRRRHTPARAGCRARRVGSATCRARARAVAAGVHQGKRGGRRGGSNAARKVRSRRRSGPA